MQSWDLEAALANSPLFHRHLRIYIKRLSTAALQQKAWCMTLHLRPDTGCAEETPPPCVGWRPVLSKLKSPTWASPSHHFIRKQPTCHITGVLCWQKWRSRDAGRSPQIHCTPACWVTQKTPGPKDPGEGCSPKVPNQISSRYIRVRSPKRDTNQSINQSVPQGVPHSIHFGQFSGAHGNVAPRTKWGWGICACMCVCVCVHAHVCVCTSVFKFYWGLRYTLFYFLLGFGSLLLVTGVINNLSNQC